MTLFAALRFTEDPNLRDRVYWYISTIPVEENERVLAPVGPHDRLQCARVERVSRGTEEPYPAALCKRVAAKYGAREIAHGCFELGGVRYDDRHYTRFGHILIAQELLDISELPFPVTVIAEEEHCLEKIAAAKDCVLLCGTWVREIASVILKIARDEETDAPLGSACAIRAKLCG